MNPGDLVVPHHPEHHPGRGVGIVLEHRLEPTGLRFHEKPLYRVVWSNGEVVDHHGYGNIQRIAMGGGG